MRGIWQRRCRTAGPASGRTTGPLYGVRGEYGKAGAGGVVGFQSSWVTKQGGARVRELTPFANGPRARKQDCTWQSAPLPPVVVRDATSVP